MGMTASIFQDVRLKPDLNHLAPDGSEIRELVRTQAVSTCHCTLQPREISLSMTHRQIEEVWYVLEGEGEVWRKRGSVERVLPVAAGTSLSIPSGTAFQFRNTGEHPLCIFIVTMPPWPGPEEAVPVEGYWPVKRHER